MSIFRRNAENVSGSWLTAQFIFIIRTRSSIWRIPIEQNVPSSSYKIITGSDSFSLSLEEEEEEEEASPSKGENRNRAGNNEKEVERIKNVKHETGQLEY